MVRNTVGSESHAPEGILSYLELKGVGPVKHLCFEPSSRLNVITGDNGFGKTFLMECAWWALSGMWAGEPVLPRQDAGIDEVEISSRLMTTSGSIGKKTTAKYDWDRQQWPRTTDEENAGGLVIYARVDGSFAVWDPVRGKLPPPVGASKRLSPLVFNKSQIYEGIVEKIPGNGNRKLCNGLVWDWTYWQNTPQSPFQLFTKILDELSTCSQEPLKPAKPVRVPGDTRQIPSLQYPYGVVPLIHTASSVQRIISLAYIALWTWEEHKIACADARKTPYKSMVLLIDEAESHLHPQWQRSIIPSLLAIGKFLDKELGIQLIFTTHSPLLMASVEAEYQEKIDRIFHLDIEDKEVVLKEQPFLRHGRVDHWFTSEAFGLQQARSLAAEPTISEAEELQQQTDPDSKKVREMHNR